MVSELVLELVSELIPKLIGDPDGCPLTAEDSGPSVETWHDIRYRALLIKRSLAMRVSNLR